MLKINNISKTFNPGTVNEKQALSGLSLHLNKGDFVTILGSNGAGKSTLFGAIAGTFLPDTGSVVIDGKDITGMTIESLRRNISPVLQDTFLFNGTISENIGYAKPNATQEEIEALSRQIRNLTMLRSAKLNTPFRDVAVPVFPAAMMAI